MKKLFAVLLALLVVGGAAFAQDAPALKLSGAIYGGLVYSYTDATDTNAVQWSRWYNGSLDALRVRVNGSYTNGNAGIAFRLQTNNPSTAPTYARAYGWAKFFDGMLKVNVGKLGDYTWATVGDNGYGNFDGAFGMQFQVMPIDGLNLGAFIPVAIPSTVTLGDTFKDIAIGAAYTLEGVADFQAGFNMNVATDTNAAWFGFNVTAVENVTAILEASLTDLGNDVTGATDLWWKFGYVMDALEVTLVATQGLTAVTTDAAALGFTPGVAYTLDPVVVGAGFTYTLNDGNVDGTNTWSIDPYVTIPVSNSEVEIGGSYADSGDYNVYAFWTFNF